ncbi:siderophore-interacting protein [Novosphingobium umbonatum]|uniref:Siderophore-interacting protein n=1 Tax=Novosphingobium umbonatum TaxID=1908524 RepID=A0A3S2X3U7_9SPHN|nr:siderophore-interacting protein [Novosphingobium umbonatum]RVU05044.1 siderophore-interacting protein [Novosphingobium umbonatum]
MTDTPTIRRMRHETCRRALTIQSVERITPHMLRITAQGPELAGFHSASPDDHIKVFVTDAQGQSAMRDYTPRHHDAQAGTLTVDFFDHEAGPASAWARQAKAGDTLHVGGPRGSQVIEGPIAHWLLIGDESALPSIGRRVEELSSDVTATVIAAVPDAADEQVLTSKAALQTHWLHRAADQATDAAPFLAALEGLAIAPQTFIWIAAEAGVARSLREALLARGIDKAWIKAAGYWVAGQADAAVKSFEDAA